MHPVLSHHSFFCNFQHLLFLICKSILPAPNTDVGDSIYNNIFIFCILIVIVYVRKAQKITG